MTGIDAALAALATVCSSVSFVKNRTTHCRTAMWC